MTELTTTLAAIRAQSPCRDGWAKLLKHVGDLPEDAPLPLLTVLDSNGAADALWVVDYVLGEPAHKALAPFIRECVLRASDHAARALPIFEARFPADGRPRKAIEAARACANGVAAADAALAAAAAADAADAARAARAAYAAAAAAAAAADAAAAAAAAYAAYAYAAYVARDAERAWQDNRLREYLTGAAQKEAA